MKKPRFINWLDQTELKDVQYVGNKCANIAEIKRAGFLVPPGFCITTYAYDYFLKETEMNKEVDAALKNVYLYEVDELKRRVDKIRQLIESKNVPSRIINDLSIAYRKLRETHNIRQVAVRSSATVEDLATASFAGQFQTFLGVHNIPALAEAIKKCWASLFLPRVAVYMKERNLLSEMTKMKMAVLIQVMVNSNISGTAFTLDQRFMNRHKIVIEASWGLGELIVSGKITPDTYVVDKRNLGLLSKRIGRKKMLQKLIADRVSVSNTPEEMRRKFCLEEDVVIRIAKVAKFIEDHFGCPQDIEWAIEDDTLFILQTRPMTGIGA